jgi:leucyl-tRNA synthetase
VPAKKLIVEIDGAHHNLQYESDDERTTVLGYLGYEVIRFTNAEVLTDIDRVINQILSTLKK